MELQCCVRVVCLCVLLSFVSSLEEVEHGRYPVKETYNVVMKNSVDFSNHLENVNEWFPQVTVVEVYWNLVNYKYLGYTAHVPVESYNAFNSTFKDILKVFEPVSFVKVSSKIDKLPYNPTFSRLDESLNLVHPGFCLITYDSYHRQLLKQWEIESTRGTILDISEEHVVTVYVFDNGIDSSHDVFMNRTVYKAPVFALPCDEVSEDPTGFPMGDGIVAEDNFAVAHGTQVASLISGRGFGVNGERVRIVDVKVLNHKGIGRIDSVLRGLNYVAGQVGVGQTGDAVMRRIRSIINMSFCGPSSKALKHAMYAMSKGILIVAAVGDYDSYNCHTTPAESPHIIAVGGTSPANLPLSGSNYGDCVDILAPGEGIATATTASQNEFLGENVGFMTGSSASAAIVSGYASLLFSALMEDNNLYARQLLMDTLNEDDITSFLRVAVLYNERAMTNKMPHSNSWIPECSIGKKDNILEMFVYSLQRIKENLRTNDPSRPKAFNNLKKNFATFMKKKNIGKYEY